MSKEKEKIIILLSNEERSLLNKASQYQGVDLEEFIIHSATSSAQETVEIVEKLGG